MVKIDSVSFELEYIFKCDRYILVPPHQFTKDFFGNLKVSLRETITVIENLVVHSSLVKISHTYGFAKRSHDIDLPSLAGVRDMANQIRLILHRWFVMTNYIKSIDLDIDITKPRNLSQILEKLSIRLQNHLSINTDRCSQIQPLSTKHLTFKRAVFVSAYIINTEILPLNIEPQSSELNE